MKVILTGNTGLIGAEVLHQCLANPAITSIIAISRRDLPITHPKLTQIKHSDFTSYPPSLLTQLKGAEACIFSLGIAMAKTPEDGQRINQEFPLATVKALSTLGSEAKPFCFVYVSGALVEKDQEKKLWLLGNMRRMRGRTELELLTLNRGSLQVRIVRPGFVGSKKGGLKDAVTEALLGLIKVDVLAAAMINIALTGSEHELVEMDELIKLGKAAKAAL